MRNEYLQGFFIDPLRKIAEPRTVKDDLQEFYKLLDCDLIDITTRPIGGRSFDIICDDEGLLKPSPIVSALFPDGSPALVGRLFVVRGDNYSGELVSLFPDDVDRILSNCVLYHPSEELRSMYEDFGVAVIIS